jgi:hypothetical protein
MSDYSSDSDNVPIVKKGTVIRKKHAVLQTQRKPAANIKLVAKTRAPSKRPVLISSSSESSSDESSSDNESEEEGTYSNDESKELTECLFDIPGKEEEPKIYVMCGNCASGKSYMLKYLMYLYAKKKMFGFGMCFTQTAFTGGYSYLPEKCVREFDMDYLESYITHLKAKTVAGKAKNGEGWTLPHNFVIIDDSIGLVTNTKFYMNFIGTHRHTRTTIFILSQLITAARSVNTVVRANTSYALMWPVAFSGATDGLWQSYGQMFTYAEFKHQLKLVGERKYACLLFKNSPTITDIKDAYCSVKASDDFPDFKLMF